MDNQTLVLIGRLLFGGYFVISGLIHFTKTKMITSVAKSKKVPMPQLATLAGGALLLFGGFGIILAAYVQLAVLSLVVFLLAGMLFVHNFWAIKDPEEKAAQTMNFLRNMAYIGGALITLTLV